MNEAVHEILQSIDAMDFNTLCPLEMKHFEYTGFDPNTFLSKAFADARERNVPPNEIKSDMVMMGILGTFRGSNVPKIMNNSSPEMKAFLSKCVRQYDLKQHPDQSNSTVTLLRLAACFADKIGVLLFEGHISLQPPVNVSAIIKANVPLQMTLSTYGSLVPPDSRMVPQYKKVLRKAFAYVQYLFDCMIKGEEEADVGNVWKYCDIQFGSKRYLEEARIAYNEKVGIIVATDTGFTLGEDSAGIIKLSVLWDELVSCS